MKKVFGEYYALSIGTLWFVSLLMIAKDALGSVLGSLTIISAIVFAVGIVKTTTDKPVRMKVVALVSSVILICILVGLFVKREVPLDSQQRTEMK